MSQITVRWKPFIWNTFAIKYRKYYDMGFQDLTFKQTVCVCFPHVVQLLSAVRMPPSHTGEKQPSDITALEGCCVETSCRYGLLRKPCGTLTKKTSCPLMPDRPLVCLIS